MYRFILVLMAAAICSITADSYDPAFKEALAQSPLRSISNIRIKGLSWNNCGKPKNAVHVHKLEVSPDLKITAHVEVSTDLDNDVEVEVKLQKKIFILGWRDIPCTHGMFGSCAFKKICDRIPKLDECPETFKELNLPCQCPIIVGASSQNFSLVEFEAIPPSNHRSIPSFLAKGDVKAQIKLKKSGENLACYHVGFTLV